MIAAQAPRRNTKCYLVRIGKIDLLFSYSTLVAARVPAGVIRAPARAYSRTTNRHITEHGFGIGKPVPAEQLVEIVERALYQQALEAIKDRISA